MALTLPNERPSRVWGPLLAVSAVVGLCALGGCATAPRTRRFPASVFLGARHESPRPHRAPPPADEGAAFVERALHRDGLRFGTDGSTRALWSYLRLSHRVVSPAAARPGDVLFFDTRGTGDAPSCDDATNHAGIAQAVSPEGRITFVEARGGRIRTSFVDPGHPGLRRDAGGEIANSFLRAKAMDDPPGARIFASQMLCGVVRPER